MRPRIFIRACARPSVARSVDQSVRQPVGSSVRLSVTSFLIQIYKIDGNCSNVRACVLVSVGRPVKVSLRPTSRPIPSSELVNSCIRPSVRLFARRSVKNKILDLGA